MTSPREWVERLEKTKSFTRTDTWKHLSYSNIWRLDKVKGPSEEDSRITHRSLKNRHYVPKIGQESMEALSGHWCGILLEGRIKWEIIGIFRRNDGETSFE